jgi:hypothetical protein
LADVLGVEPGRQPTIAVDKTMPVIDRRFLRPDWHLVVPPPKSHETVIRDTDSGADRGPLVQTVRDEALLVPLVGDVAAPPVVITTDLLAWAGGAVQVGLRWLPVMAFPYPRALAVALDHPFVRLQRLLAAASSTVPHLAQQDVAPVLVPAASEALWAHWEAQLVQAHMVLFRAADTVSQAIRAAARWYARAGGRLAWVS